MSVFLDSHHGIHDAIAHMPVRLLVRTVSEHTAREAKCGLQLLDFGIEQCTFPQQLATGVKRNVALLAIANDFQLDLLNVFVAGYSARMKRSM
jgi:hypothetical protein